MLIYIGRNGHHSVSCIITFVDVDYPTRPRSQGHLRHAAVLSVFFTGRGAIEPCKLTTWTKRYIS